MFHRTALRLLTLCVFEGFFGKLFVLFFVCGKTPVPGVFPQEHTTHFLHEALWGKGFKFNSLDCALLGKKYFFVLQDAQTCAFTILGCGESTPYSAQYTPHPRVRNVGWISSCFRTYSENSGQAIRLLVE